MAAISMSSAASVATTTAVSCTIPVSPKIAEEPKSFVSTIEQRNVLRSIKADTSVEIFQRTLIKNLHYRHVYRVNEFEEEPSGLYKRHATALHQAARVGNCALIEFIVEDGGKDLLELSNGDDGTPLRIAILGSKHDAARTLIKLGADQSVTSWGVTLLMDALNGIKQSTKEDLDFAREMIWNGALYNTQFDKEPIFETFTYVERGGRQKKYKPLVLEVVGQADNVLNTALNSEMSPCIPVVDLRRLIREYLIFCPPQAWLNSIKLG